MRRPRSFPVISLLALLALAVVFGACQEAQDDFVQARAYVVTSRSELIGGRKAIGREGDVILENDKIRVLVNAHATDPNTTKRGGALVDADIQRWGDFFNPVAGGQDQLVEITPLIDVRTFGIETITASGPVLRVPQDAEEIVNEGSEDEAAVVRVSGELSNIFELFRLLPTPLTYLPVRATTTYTLAPGKRYVEIETTYEILNRDGTPADETVEVPVRPIADDENPILGVVTGEVFGDAIFFGGSTDTFGPNVFGFSPSWYIEEAYRRGVSTITSPPRMEWIAGVADKIGYGLVSTEGKLVFPLIEDFLTAAFQQITEDGYTFAQPGYTYSFKRYFVVNDGDVAGILDEVISLKKWAHARLEGRVFDAGIGAPLSGANVQVFVHPRYADGSLVPVKPTLDEMNAFLDQLEADAVTAHRLIPYDRFTTDSRYLDSTADGSFAGNLPIFAEDGREHYILLATGPGHSRGKLFPVELREGQTKKVSLEVAQTGKIAFTVRSLDPRGEQQACKVTAVSLEGAGRPDPFIGEGYLPAEEAALVHTADGTGEITLPAGRYRLIANRGPEYSHDECEVTVKASETQQVDFEIARVVDTSGWLAADLHFHSELSPDSGVTLEKRVRSALVEAIDVMAGTDHDFLTNYRPILEKMGGLNQVYVMVGDELSQLQYGHFNSYPLRYDQTKVANGAPNWREPSPTGAYGDGTPYPYWTPQDAFDGLRALGDFDLIDQEPMVVVNHSRESFTGYLRAFGYQQYYGTFGTPDILTLGDPVVNNGKIFSKDGSANFSWDFNGMEVLNAKRWADMRTATVEDIPQGVFGQPTPPDAELLPILVRTAQEQLRIESGELLLDHTEQGMLDDYLTLLAQGRRIAPLGNSDSHSTTTTEIGKCRTYVMSDTDDPAFVDPDRFITNLKAGRTVATTGPFVEVWVDGAPIGADVFAPAGQIAVRIRAQAPEWMSLDRFEIYGNGVLIGEIGADSDPNIFLGCDTAGLEVNGREDVVRLDDSFTCELEADTNIVVVAIGYEGMTPMSQPQEGPAVEITDTLILGVNQLLADWLGVGNLIPLDGVVERNHPIYPFAVTGAIWVDTDGRDIDGDGYPYDGPGYVPGWFDEEDVPANTAASMSSLRQSAVSAAVGRVLSFTSELRMPLASGQPGTAAVDEDEEDDEYGGCGSPNW